MGGGGATGAATPTHIMKKMVGESSAQDTPEEVKFGGVLGMLNVADRVKPVEDIDIGRVRLACEVLDEPERFSKVVGTLRCVGIFIPRARGAQQLSDG